jgi:hypothetical protein
VAGLVQEALDHARRVELEQRERARLVELGLPMSDLPLLAEGIDVGALYILAETLRQGLTHAA